MNKKIKKIIITLAIMAFLLLIIFPIGLSIYIYQSNFGQRYTTTSWMKRNISEFDGLNAQQYSFKSNNSQDLIGYKYYKEGLETKGVVVISHGLGGGGHNSYMDIADYFASKGYIVFAYDATGNDESGGESVNGIPQGLIDLDYALNFIKETAEFDGLPVMLFGHSWGAYSAGNVLNIHPDVNAVVMVAGFNRSVELIEEEGERMMGSGIRYLIPYVSLIENIKFGKYANYACTDGFENSKANVMIIHSSDDKMISYENQFLSFKNTYQNNPRFTFISFDDRGHDYIYYSDISREYKEELNSQFSEYVNSLEGELTAEVKTAYMETNLDKSKLFDLDADLMNDIVMFYDNSIK